MPSKLIHFRVTEDEFRKLQAAATKRRLGPHIYAREVMREGLDAQPAPGLQELGELRKAIATLTQQGQRSESPELRVELGRFRNALANATLLILDAVGMDAQEANRRVSEHVRR